MNITKLDLKLVTKDSLTGAKSTYQLHMSKKDLQIILITNARTGITGAVMTHPIFAKLDSEVFVPYRKEYLGQLETNQIEKSTFGWIKRGHMGKLSSAFTYGKDKQRWLYLEVADLPNGLYSSCVAHIKMKNMLSLTYLEAPELSPIGMRLLRNSKTDSSMTHAIVDALGISEVLKSSYSQILNWTQNALAKIGGDCTE